MMRDVFAKAVIEYADDAYFLTGDLGFMALEEVRDAFGPRFINCGVAEQNMIGAAAGLAREGHKVFVYSIAPFLYARAFEQIRNGLCMGSLPVCLVGNGGGYAYGIMGPTHHALEDCAVMNALGVRVMVPAFNEDIATMLAGITGPTYLRLGRDERPREMVSIGYAPWRKILDGNNGVIAALGPLAEVVRQAFRYTPDNDRPSVWGVSEFTPVPDAVWSDSMQGICQGNIYVVEEHIATGGLGAHIAIAMAKENMPTVFTHRYALGYPSGRYGSQAFHRAECGLDVEGIRRMVADAR